MTQEEKIKICRGCMSGDERSCSIENCIIFQYGDVEKCHCRQCLIKVICRVICSPLILMIDEISKSGRYRTYKETIIGKEV